MPLVVLLPLVLGALRIAAEELGLFDEHVGLALTTVASILILIAVIFVSVREQRIADRARRELAAIVGGTADAVIGWGLDGIVTSWNRGAERIYGYSADEMVGRRLDLLVPPGQRASCPAARAGRAGERIESYETVRMRKDGRRIDIALTVSPIRDERGAVTGVSTIARDISEQKAAERRLAESARHFELINDLVATCGFDGYFKRLNDAWEPTLGWTGPSCSRSRSSRSSIPRTARPSRPRSPGSRGGETTAEFKIRVRTRDGPLAVDRVVGVAGCRRRPLLLRRARDQRADGGRAGARRRAPAVRRRPADRQRRQLGAQPRDGRAHLVGAALPQPRLRARDGAAEPRASCSSGSTPRIASSRASGWADLREGERELSFAYRVVLGDGRMREIEVEGRPLVDADGTPPARDQPRRHRRARRRAAQGRLLRPRLT